MIKATRKDNGKWKIQPSKMVDGKLIRKTFTCNTKKEAEQAAAEWLSSNSTITDGLTFYEAVDRYIEMKSEILSPSTITGYRKIQKRETEDISSVKLDQLNKNRLQRYANKLAGKYSAKTVRNIFGLIFAVLGQFSGERIPKISLPPLVKPKTEALEGEQIGKFINALKGERTEIPLLLALWLGLRKSEILGLKWEDVDLKKGVLRVRNAKVLNEKNEYVETRTTKTYLSNRTLPIPLYIQEKLRAVEDKEGYVCKNSPNVLYKDARRIAKSIGVENIGMHDLRRTMATLGLSLHIPDKVMMQRGGWSTPQVMQNAYQMVFSNEYMVASSLIDDYIMKMAERNEEGDSEASK